MSKASEFPRKFNTHIIRDTRSGVLFYDNSPNPYHAILQVIEEHGPDEFELLGPEVHAKVHELSIVALTAVVGFGSMPEGLVYEVINVGPFETTGGKLDVKNMHFTSIRFTEIVAGSALTDDDKELADWVKMKNAKADIATEKRLAEKSGEVNSLLDQIFPGMKFN